jgi:hypothetical protein
MTTAVDEQLYEFLGSEFIAQSDSGCDAYDHLACTVNMEFPDLMFTTAPSVLIRTNA